MTAATAQEWSHAFGAGPGDRTPLFSTVPPASGALAHRYLRQGEFWRAVPAYSNADEPTFLDHIWQGRRSIKTRGTARNDPRFGAPQSFFEDAREAFRRAPMAVRVSPYLIALIDWNAPYTDPIRRQFIPVASQLRPDHPRLTTDSLHEQADSPVPGLTHRYADKELFLPTSFAIRPAIKRRLTRSFSSVQSTSRQFNRLLNPTGAGSHYPRHASLSTRDL